jgi:outer membrane protein assembly factor BamB
MACASPAMASTEPVAPGLHSIGHGCSRPLTMRRCATSSRKSTAGGLVFGGSEEGDFFALDAETGKPLWDTQIGGAVRGIPISYAVDGKQYIAIAAGFTLFVLSL